MRSEYSIRLLALVVLYVANGRDGVHHVHGMVANHHHRQHNGEFRRDFKFSCHVPLIILFSLWNVKNEKKRTFKFFDKFGMRKCPL